MGSEKNVNYKEIGSVTYRRNRKARNISIRISREGDVRVTVPGNCSVRTAEGFVHRKSAWIKKKLLEIERTKHEKLAWSPGDVIDLLGNELRLVPGDGEHFRTVKEGSDYLLRLPAEFRGEDPQMAGRLREEILKIGQQEARARLPVLCASLACCHDLTYSKVSVRSMKSRWGSCSARNSISLNSALIFLDRRLVEYVILHELVHTMHRNHGPDFWRTLEKYVPDALQRRKELRQVNMMV